MSQRNAKPFIKWPGGKRQLIDTIANNLPSGWRDMEKITYIEPFVGAGALFFWILRRYPNITQAVINDLNEDLINTYRVIKANPQRLIKCLGEIESQYHALQTLDAKRDFFLQQRETFNNRRMK